MYTLAEANTLVAFGKDKLPNLFRRLMLSGNEEIDFETGQNHFRTVLDFDTHSDLKTQNLSFKIRIKSK